MTKKSSYQRRSRAVKSRRRKQNKCVDKFNVTLKRLKSLRAGQRKQAIEIANDKFIRHFINKVKKLRRASNLRPAIKARIKRNAQKLRKFTGKRCSLKSKRQMLTQRGGFLPLLLAALPAIGSIAGGIISRA